MGSCSPGAHRPSAGCRAKPQRRRERPQPLGRWRGRQHRWPGHRCPATFSRWRAEPMTVRWVIGNWGEACGPRPQGGGDTGGDVSVEERADELVITSEGGSFTTSQCWQMHPALDPQSHTHSGNVWKTTCRTAPSDPRQEVPRPRSAPTMGHDLPAGVWPATSLSLEARPARRAPAAGAPTGVWPRAAPPRPSVPPCASPGVPARIEVRPSRKLMRAGRIVQLPRQRLRRTGLQCGHSPLPGAYRPRGPRRASRRGGSASPRVRSTPSSA